MDAVEFQQLAAGSRTYRRYGARPLRRDELLGLVEAARLAPTGNNSQQLRFRVVPGMEDPAWRRGRGNCHARRQARFTASAMSAMTARSAAR